MSPRDPITAAAPPDAAAGPGRVDPAHARRIAGGATTASVSVAAVLVVAKLAAFIVTDSVAMLASLFDSALDLFASLTAFFAVRYAAKPADQEHRFGHGKAEAFSSFLQAALISASSIFLFWEGGRRLLAPEPIHAGGLALGVMALSMVLTIALIRLQTRAIRRTGSVAVKGDRAHYASDLITNAAVALGIALAWFAGLERADPILAIAVGGWLLFTAFTVGREAVNQLLDRELSDAERAEIEALATDDPDVLGIHELRTRASGPLLHIQLHMDLEPHQSLIRAHEIVVRAERRILKRFPAADILIHADPRGHAEEHGHGFFDTDLAAEPGREHHARRDEPR
jgi:ferrous-iron efflux pump FieF